MGRGGYRAEHEECTNGHEFTEENTRVTREGYRICRACNRERMQRNRAQNKDDKR